MVEMQRELLEKKPDELSDDQYQDLRKEVGDAVVKLNEDCEKMKVVHKKLDEIEQVKKEIALWSSGVVKGSDEIKGALRKVNKFYCIPLRLFTTFFFEVEHCHSNGQIVCLSSYGSAYDVMACFSLKQIFYIGILHS